MSVRGGHLAVPQQEENAAEIDRRYESGVAERIQSSERAPRCRASSRYRMRTDFGPASGMIRADAQPGDRAERFPAPGRHGPRPYIPSGRVGSGRNGPDSGELWKPSPKRGIFPGRVRRAGAYAPRAAPLPGSARKKDVGGCNTRTSQEVTHPSTTLAQARLTAEF